MTSVGRPASSALNRSTVRSSRGKTPYLVASSMNRRCRSRSLSGLLRREVAGLGPVGAAVVELPDVVVERAFASASPTACGAWSQPTSRGGRCPGCPCISKYWVSALFGSVCVVEAVGHAHAVQGHLLQPVHESRLGDARDVEDGGGDVDDVVELVAALATGLGSVAATTRSCRCVCRPSARRPAWSTGTACTSREPSRPRSGCTRPDCRCCRRARRGTPGSPASAAPLKMNISLKLPLIVPSALAPLSPMIR